MILYFLRHADAEPAGPEGDAARRLSPAGLAALRAAGPLLRRLNLRPDAVLSSPLPRAMQTAELLVEGIGLDRAPQPDDRLAPGATWADFARAMTAHPGARRVLFVGHEPDLSSAIAALTGAASVRMRKGGLACVEFPGTPEPGTGELAWLIDPDLYRAEEEPAGA
ncbi:MAG TPA: histidine phosphatase family protein [candidate division Zixibacteria bacterium]|nr:histidine phosphatase family protein [candidate division Zixibacteria bacterium]